MTPRAQVAAVLCVLAGCGELQAVRPGSEPQAVRSGSESQAVRSGGVDAGRAAEAPRLLVQVLESTPGGSDVELGLEGVRVCVEGLDPEPPCLTTDGDGYVVVEDLPPDIELLLSLTRDGYEPTLRPLITPRATRRLDGFRGIRMSSARIVQDQLEGLNAVLAEDGLPAVELHPERGRVVFGALASGNYNLLGRVSFALDPSSGDGPYFTDMDERIHPMPVGGPSGVFYNVQPGETELIFGYDGGDCIYSPGPHAGWPSPGRDNAARIPVRAGHLTYWTALDCHQYEADGGADD